jgi:glucuronokinase
MAADGSDRGYDRAAVSDRLQQAPTAHAAFAAKAAHPRTGVTHARAALLGNPSDGFGGATIAFELRQLAAEVEARAGSSVTIGAEGSRLEFADAAELVAAGRNRDYPTGGPAALLMAAAKRYCERLAAGGVELGELGFDLQLRASSIPPQVGLAGSSAIVISALRALCELFADEIPNELLPGLALATETEELGISAGLQDRVVQSYGGLVFMDFNPKLMAEHGHGDYVPLDRHLLPPLVVAYRRDAAGDSGVTHAPMHERFDAGEPAVVETMEAIGALSHEGRDALLSGDRARLGELMDRNFELRRSIYELDPRHTAMIEAARSVGAAANFAGSGGAVVALAPDGRLDETESALRSAGARTIRSEPR